jgi:dolichol-phosphate mannosyltransferase
MMFYLFNPVGQLKPVFFPIPGLKEYSCGFRGFRAEKIKEAVCLYFENLK